MVSTKDCLNATIYSVNVADHMSQFMATIHLSSGSHFQQDIALCHKSIMVTDWFMEHSKCIKELSIVTGSPFHTVSLRCNGKRYLNPECSVNQSMRCYNNSMGTNFKWVLPEHHRIHFKKKWGGSKDISCPTQY